MNTEETTHRVKPASVTRIEPRIGPLTRIRELLRYRELLGNLIRKELKVKYKNSALGFAWSLLNPLLYLVIFSIVLQEFLGAGLPAFPFYLLTGLLAWNLLSNGLAGATGSIVSNSNLVSKVYFPREILPAASIGAAVVHYVLQLFVLVAAMLLFGWFRHWDQGMVLLPLALLVQLVLLVGLALLMSSANVYMRDVQHLLELALLAWFWMTPIVYASGWVQQNLMNKSPLMWAVYLQNPMAPIVMGYQRALYARPELRAGDAHVLVNAPLEWYAKRLGWTGLVAVAILMVGWTAFRRLETRMAEEL